MGHFVVVDGDQRAQRALVDLLLKLGHRVDAGDGISAVRGALLERPELLFVGAGPGGADIDRRWAQLAELGQPAPVVWTGPLRELVEPALDAGIGADFLAVPPRAPAVVALIARHLSQAPAERWSGADFLVGLAGPASRFSPARVAFLAHRVGATGWLELSLPGGAEAVAFLGGRVVGLETAGGLAAALGPAGAVPAGPGDLNRLIGAAIAGGTSPDDALHAVALALGALWISAPGEATVRWTDAPPPRPLALPLTVPRLLARALELRRPAALLRVELGARPSDRLHLALPDDSEESSWGLSPAALRLIRAAGRTGTLGGVIGAGGADRDDVWLALDYLLQLGLISTESAADSDLVGISVEAVEAVEAPAAPRAAPPPRAPAPAPVAAPARPAPSAAPDPEVAALQATLAALEAATPLEIFELKVPAEVNLEEIDRRFRARSAPMHPDRRVGQAPEVQRLAAECFARIQAARMAFDSEDLRREARERLLAAAEGRVYVSEADKRSARLLFKRGEAALRAKKFAEAADQLGEAAKLDPLDWEIALLQAQADWRSDRCPPRAAAERLLAIKTERRSSNAEIQFQAGELLLAAGDEPAAYACFAVSVEKDPEHVGAQRRIRLRSSRDARAAEAAKPATPLADTLKGLFSWGKKGG